MVIAGFFTSGVVLSTIREACDMDYSISVLADCCADADSEKHEFLVNKIFPDQAKVVTAEEWITAVSN